MEIMMNEDLIARLENAIRDIEQLKARIAVLEDVPKIPAPPVLPPMPVMPIYPMEPLDWGTNRLPFEIHQTWVSDHTTPLEVRNGKTD